MASHGTYAGWNWHLRHKVPMCLDCREAARQYQAEWRTKNQEADAEQRRMTNVRGRAMRRLARLYPNQFRALVKLEEDRERAS